MSVSLTTRGITLPWWWRACSLRERRDLFANLGLLPALDRGGRELVEQWRKQALLTQEELFQKRLAADGLDAETMAALLSLSKAVEEEPGDGSRSSPAGRDRLENAADPDWAAIFREAVGLLEREESEAIQCRGLDNAVRPFLLWALRRWRERFSPDSEDSRIHWEPVIQSAVETMAAQLVQIAARALVLELNVCRLREQLEGETPQERYRSFLRLLQDPRWLSGFYGEYVVLARLLTVRTQFYVHHVTEVLERYLADRETLRDVLNLDRSPLVEIRPGLGDSHRQGRAVTRLRFASGRVILYKPRPLAGAVRIQRLLSWINDKGFTPALMTVPIVDRGQYGWEPYIEAAPCTGEEEVRRFYRRIGALTAVAYAIRGHDFHFENLIACGEHPVLVDWETIFVNRPPYRFPDTADVRAKQQMVDSVLGTGLLPLLLVQTADGAGVELSGLGGREQVLPRPVLQVENEGTDEMRFVRKPKSLEAAANRPWMEGPEGPVYMEAADFAGEIVAGFRETCEILIAHRDELLAPEGPLAGFREVPVRVLLRATQHYANFLLESWHPDYLRDALDRERLVDRLWYAPVDPRFVPYERDDVMEGDVPYFTTTPVSKDVWDGRGRKIPGVFARSGFELVEERLRNLTVQEVDLQSNWVRSSLVALRDQEEEPAPSGRGLPEEIRDVSIDAGVFVEEAEAIGRHLTETAIWGPDRRDCTWIGAGVNHRGQWSVAPMDAGLYNGVAGVALFLGYLGWVTGDGTFRQAARAAMETALQKAPFLTKFPSAFFGLGSVLYALSHLGPILDGPKWLEGMEEIVRLMGRAVEEDRYYDLLSGGAGVVHVLLNVYEQFGLPSALGAASAYGDHLCRNRRATGKGAAWFGEGKEDRGLAGMAHGVAGISWALLRLAAATGKEEYRRVAEEGLAYERSLFHPGAGNWEDRRFEGDKAFSSVAWCHGAPGIGLSRLLSLDYVSPSQRAEMAGEIRTAVSTLLSRGLGRSHCLCHGDLGNAEFLLRAGSRLGNPDLVAKARWIGVQVMEEKRRLGGYRFGTPQGLPSAGLWLGEAGIGYQLLRLAHPDRVPSVLSLDRAGNGQI
ncbi:MAG: type 2 lanthipeptide synthetase LanM family protein [Alicyclobacillaceae bacterium]|nr:type 2 lanthipeptide synthetase LanM family protein [Alicyclobacillaceae bacterium]